jgi:flagellar motility protein MotE (MotC chaperone)
MKWLGEFRLLPVLLIAAGGLFALKSIGLMFDGGYTLSQRLGSGGSLVVTTVPVPPAVELRSPSAPLEIAGQSPSGPKSWMQEMFNYPDITGSVASKPAAKPEEKDKKEPPPVAGAPATKPAAGTVIPLDQARQPSPAERALLERLQERRQELDARARELDLRESMVKAAEKKLEDNSAQKATEAKEGSPTQRKEEAENARMKSIVTMYETMKPKEAAKIFDRLDIRVLMDVASQINPRTMSAILAQMSPEAAERLTVEFAARSDRPVDPASLPKIEGRPSN